MQKYRAQVFFYSFYNDCYMTKEVELDFVPQKDMMLLHLLGGIPLKVKRVSFVGHKFIVVIKNRFKYSEEYLNKMQTRGWKRNYLIRLIEDPKH